MSSYNALPFEIHDKILSTLCQNCTYKDIVAYSLISKYHYDLIKQNYHVKAFKKTARFFSVKKRCAMENHTIHFTMPYSLHFLDGVYIENTCGRLLKAEFTGNEYTFEQLDNPELSDGWIPFEFSKHHGGFPILPMVYIHFSITLTFDKPQHDTLKIGVHGKTILNNDAYWSMFVPFELSYPKTQRIKVAGGSFSIVGS